MNHQPGSCDAPFDSLTLGMGSQAVVIACLEKPYDKLDFDNGRIGKRMPDGIPVVDDTPRHIAADSDMKLTMIVSGRNGMRYLERCLQSVVTAGRGLNVEVLYQDGCSTDGSIECATRLLGADAVHVEADEGFSDGVNRAFRRATGDVIGVLPADDMLAPDSLRCVIEAFTANPATQWAIGYYEIIDANDSPIRPLHTWYKNRAIKHFRLWRLMLENIIPFVSFFIRRPFRESVGDFITEKESIACDYDYFIRCAKRHDPLIIPHVLGRWRYHATSNSGSKMWRMSWDAWRICRNHTSNPLLIAGNGLCCLRNALLFDKIG